MVSQLIFSCLVLVALAGFGINSGKLVRNIRMGRPVNRRDQGWRRLGVMLRVAFGQSKMNVHIVPAMLHLIVYIGFLVVNIEVLEILLDGILGKHRVFHGFGLYYDLLIGSFEVFAILVWLACIAFLIRRNIYRIKRFNGIEMNNGAKGDANAILIMEVLLMSAFLLMNAADFKLQLLGDAHYPLAGTFPVSRNLLALLPETAGSLRIIERICWWFHITGILIFLNYLPYSKHMHIFLAFPNTFFSKLGAMGALNNMDSITNEVKSALIPTYMPVEMEPSSFGARDVADLSWVNLLNAYSCTQCGRCTAACPANLTGKILSPRKVMMDTRQRSSELGEAVSRNGKGYHDGKHLLDDYISREEIWACTSCNACVQACPVNIDPLSIILELRRYVVMEESAAPAALNAVMGNIENNGAPWKFSPADRFNWADDE